VTFGKLGSLVTVNPNPVGIFTASSGSETVTVYVNNKNNVDARYSIGVTTSYGVTTHEITTTFELAGNYTLDGYDRNGLVMGYNRTVTVYVGDTLTFDNTATWESHPMYLRVSPGGSSVDGATGEGTATVSWTPTAAGTYYYQCSVHSNMLGTLIVEDVPLPTYVNYVNRRNHIQAVETIEEDKLYIDQGESVFVQSSIADVSFLVIGVGGGGSTGYGASDTFTTSDSTKGNNVTLSTPGADVVYTLGVNNNGHANSRIFVGVADTAGNLNEGWITYGSLIGPGGNYTIQDLYVGQDQSIIVKASEPNVSFVSLVNVASSGGGGGGGGGGAAGLWEQTGVGINTISNVGVATTAPQTQLQLGQSFGLQGGIGTFTAAVGVATVLDSYTLTDTDFQLAEYTVHLQNQNNTQAQKIMILNLGGGSVSFQPYAIMTNQNTIAGLGVTINSGDLQLRATPEAGITGLTTFRFSRSTLL